MLVDSAAAAAPEITYPVWEWFDNQALQWKPYSDSADIERRMQTKSTPASRVLTVGLRSFLLDFDAMTQTALVRLPGNVGRFQKSGFSRPIRRRVGPPPLVPHLTPLLKEMVRRGDVAIDQALMMMGYTAPVSSLRDFWSVKKISYIDIFRVDKRALRPMDVWRRI